MALDSSGRDSLVGQNLGYYRILARIGSGGMGVVYRAHDDQLDRDVALKILPPGSLAEEAARSRFRREALALGKLNHPNIETVYEFRSANGVDYLAMELIPGKTLHAKLAAGCLSNRETLRLGIQLAEGLDAAHSQGIIHRDLKPGNLMVLPDGRLKILDFGLARLVQPGAEQGMARTVTETTSFSGTLPYMSPEQLKGLPVDARSDIFSAGAVLYEMVTAQKPFPQSQSAELIGAILHKDPPSVSSINDHVSPTLAAVIHKCLEKDTRDRYQSARELRAALEAANTTAIESAKDRRRWPLLGVTSVILIVVLAAGIVLGLNIRGWRDRVLRSDHREGRSAATLPAAIKPRRSIAVLGFKNLSGRSDLAWLSTAISEMVTTELAAGEQLRTVPGESIAQMKISLALPEADSFSKETLARIRQNVGTDEVVLGSYLPLGNGLIRLDLRLQDAVAGETRASISEKGPESRLDELVSDAAADLRAKLGVGGLSEVQSVAVRASFPSDPEAARLYAEGLSKLRVLDSVGARDLLEAAVAAEPNFSLSHDALAMAWAGLGYDAKAREEARKAFELSTGLPREERLSVESRYRATSNDWNKAVEIYRALSDFFPDNLEYRLLLAGAQTRAGKGQEALSSVELLRKFPPPQRDDPRIDLAEASAAKFLGNFRRIEALAVQAATKAQAQGSQLVLAQARTLECVALRQQGKAKEAIARCEEAQSIYAAVGDKAGVATVLNSVANSYYEQGDLAGAKQSYERSLATYRQIGNQRGVAGALDNIASLLGDWGDSAGAKKRSEQALKIYREIGDDTGVGETLNNIAAEELILGDLEGARTTFQQALDIWRRTGDRTGAATTLNNLGDMLLGQGDLAQANSRYQEALSTFRETEQKSKSAYPLVGLAEVLSAQGDLKAAKEKFEEALAISRETDDKHESAVALFGIASVLEHEGDLLTARQRHEEALAMRKEIGEKQGEAESVLALAELGLEEGHAKDAETLAYRALVEFQAEKLREDEILARTVLARSLMAQDKPAEARKQIDLAALAAARSPLIEVRLNYAIASARTRGLSGGAAEATRSLEASFAEASTHGYVGYQYEVRLTQGELEMKSGNTITGRTRLVALEKDARAKGFFLIARKALAASRAPS